MGKLFGLPRKPPQQIAHSYHMAQKYREELWEATTKSFRKTNIALQKSVILKKIPYTCWKHRTKNNKLRAFSGGYILKEAV